MNIFSPVTGIIDSVKETEVGRFEIIFNLNGLFSKGVYAPTSAIIKSITEINEEELAFEMSPLEAPDALKSITLIGKKAYSKTFYLMPGDKIEQGAKLFRALKSTSIRLLLNCAIHQLTVKEGDSVKSKVSPLAKME